jgi:hypothetical protein
MLGSAFLGSHTALSNTPSCFAHAGADQRLPARGREEIAFDARDLSGKDTTSRWHPPLRTGREGFPSSGSSRWEARRRNRTGQTQCRRWGMGPPTGLPGHRSAVSKVRPPSRIIGVSLSPDLQVPPDHGFVGTDQRQPVPLTLWGPNPGVGREAPASPTDRVPVTIQHPIGALTLMPASSPAPKTMPEHKVHLAERAGSHHVPVIHTPTE